MLNIKQFILLLITSLSFAFSEQDTHAENSKNKGFYVKVRNSIGYEYQRYTGNEIKYIWKNIEEISDFDKNKSNRAVIFSLQYNMYYQLNKVFALLGGLEIQGRHNITKKDVVKLNNNISVQYNEFLRLNARLGFKLNLGKKIATELYGIIGGNMVEYKNFEALDIKEIHNNNKKFTNFGLTTGIGIDFVIIEKFIIGVECRRNSIKIGTLRSNELNSQNNEIKVINDKFKMKTNSILVKIGYQFG